jgi:hypothetical protein
MGFDELVEKKIQEAIERGDFDNLSGQGKPLDHEAYFNTPADLRAAHSMLKSGGFIPEELALLKEIWALKQRLARLTDERERAKVRRAISDRQLKYDVLMELHQNRRRAARKSAI